jgi:hypothetical protein
MPHKIDETIARICTAAFKLRRSNHRPAAEGNGNGKE